LSGASRARCDGRNSTLRAVERSQIELGTVFRWSTDDTPMRVLVHDDDVVMHDAWWPHLNGWGLANLAELKGKRISYYVAPDSTLVEKATYLRTEPLTDGEIAVHRPELPFSAVRCAGVDWPAAAPASTDELISTGCEVTRTVDAAEIYLYPFGPNGAQKPGVRVKADNGTGFTAAELIGKAAAVQARYLGRTKLVDGAGIYRDGLNRGIPAYYLWGHESRLETQIAAAQRRQRSV
jgi:hypothetical protein